MPSFALELLRLQQMDRKLNTADKEKMKRLAGQLRVYNEQREASHDRMMAYRLHLHIFVVVA